MMAHVCCHQQNLITLHRKSPIAVTQTNTNLAGAKCIPNKPTNGLDHEKISKRSLEMTMVSSAKALCTLGIELCLKMVFELGFAVPL